jgi:hypothetical protein
LWPVLAYLDIGPVVMRGFIIEGKTPMGVRLKLVGVEISNGL